MDTPSASPPTKPLSEMTQTELLIECERRLAISQEKDMEARLASEAVQEVFRLLYRPLPLLDRLDKGGL